MKKIAQYIVWTLFFTLLAGLIPQFVHADDVFVIVMQKQTEKRSKSWSLSDWFVTKKKIALMDQWLAMNSSANIFEFFLSGTKSNYKFHSNDETILRDAFSGRLGGYVTIFGIEAEYERSNEKYAASTGLFALRLLGTSNQATNLTLHLGMRNIRFTGLSETHNNYFYGGRVSLNLLSFFGLEGLYRRYLPNDTSGNSSYGRLIEYGAFLDIYFLRLFGVIYKEKQHYGLPNSTRLDRRDGTKLGFTIFM